MWISDFITKNSFKERNADTGEIFAASGGQASVSATVDRFSLRQIAPYGIAFVPPAGSRSVVLPTDDGDFLVGVLSENRELEPGEIMLYSAGGASIVLKNDGSVLINGRAV